jgi:hypothetical protein
MARSRLGRVDRDHYYRSELAHVDQSKVIFRKLGGSINVFSSGQKAENV